MKKGYYLFLPILSAALSVFFIIGCSQKFSESAEENDKYDGPGQAIEFEIERTKDPATGRVPTLKMLDAIMQTEQMKNDLRNSPATITALSWQERGPNGDFTVGGNPRPTGQQTSGRIRALMVDSTDPTHKTVWAGGVDGGLWKTTDITVSPSPWVLINDFLSNLAVSAICQDPRPGFQNNMYFCTGESFRNADGVRGVGVFKSTDGGVTWNYLSSTSAYILCSRILCDFQGNVYLATRNSAGAPGGLYRSTNGGTSWTNITPTGVPSQSICDIEISSTAVAGRLHMTTGIGTAQTYRYTDVPATVTPGSGWNAATTPFPSFNERCEMACSGNVLYALPCDNASNNVPVIYKSTDGGDNWTATGGQPASGWASGQGWYSLSCGINPANTDECIVGGLDCHKTTNGGTSWTKITSWATSTTGFYVHADQHNIQWWDGGTKLMYGCDGGVHFSTNGGATNSDRNKGLRLKQFYSVAIHPAAGSNHFIAGAQDNGMHKMNHVGLDSSMEVVGGDGCYSAIDQDEPQYQYGSYVFNVYRRSTNGGASWSTPVNNQSTGRFVNPWDLDNNTNIIYACNNAGTYLRWDDPHTGGTTNVIPVAAFGSGNVSAVHASPYTAHRVFFGMGTGTLFMVDGANGASPTATNITPAGSSGYLNCVVTGSSDQNLIATYSSYGVMNVWVSTNGGTTWTGIDGNLPDMPVRWALFHPDSDTKAYIATETGVWETDLINGASTVWTPNTSFPTVRTDMIKYRTSDRTIAAGTHGRGIWSAVIPTAGGFTLNAPAPAPVTCPAPASMQTTITAAYSGGFVNNITLSASGNPGGTTVVFGTNPLTTLNPSSTVTLTGTNTLPFGSYTITVTGVASGAPNQTQNITYTINPGAGPIINTHPATQAICQGGTVTFTVAATGATGYQWQKSTDGGVNWNNIGGATATAYSIVNVQLSDAAQYRCVASSLCGASNSNAAVLTVNTSPAIIAHPQDVTLCTGSNNTFSVTASGSGLAYQWQSAATCAGSFSNIGGATSSTLNVTAVATTAYRCIVSGTCTPSITSNCALMTVVNSVTITGQPTNATVCEGNNTSFTAAGGGSGLTYQWQLSTNGGGVWGNISGATSTTYNITGATFAMNNNQYRCVISNGICPTPGITNAATLTVNQLAAITAQPADVTLCTGSNNTFCVTAVGTSLTYQWQSAPSCTAPWTNIAGATSSCFTANGITTTSYRCMVTSTACGNSITSNCVTRTVINPVTITTQPANAEICSGRNTSFSVAGNSTQAIIYQWQLSTDGGTNWNNVTNTGVYTGATSAMLTITGATTSLSGNRYRCQLSNATCGTPAISNAGLLTVRQLPTVGLNAAPLLALLPGQSTTLTATPSSTTGGTLSYSWFFNGNAITNTGNTRVVNVEQVGSYFVRIQEIFAGGLVCTNLSAVVPIIATPSPRLFIFPSPNDGTFKVAYYNDGGANTKRSIAISDSKGSMVYNTQFDISGAYTLLNIDLRTAGTGIYYVVVGDANGKKLATGKVHVR